ncbi:hypothetical protein M2160_008100 [Streptomyces sp. SAI-117]|nr:hypothetical protein [Streptomyces sp. SAI-117]MDH6581959.1 hypothetical protein [Streptomyces sp. SAI-133]
MPAPPEGGASDEPGARIDPGPDQTAFVTGTQFAPENGAIAHHTIV